MIDDKGRNEKEFLAQYKPRNYDKPSVTVDILIFTDTIPLRLLLIKRKQHPYISHWAIPGGFVNMDEDIVESAYRELKEETGIEAIHLTQLHTYGSVNRDPRMRVISIAYVAIIPDVLEVVASDDAKEAHWFEVYQDENFIDLLDTERNNHIRYQIIKGLPQKVDEYDALAFDHIQILLDALQSLKKT